jgi:hypothetical protein
MTLSVFARALGVSCDYCHAPGRWDSDDKPAKRTARLMLRVFDQIPPYFEKRRWPDLQCYTCREGALKSQTRAGPLTRCDWA